MDGAIELVLVDDVSAAGLTWALQRGLVAAPGPLRWVSASDAEAAVGRPGTVVLAPTAAVASVITTHVAVADLAIVAQTRGACALTTARRPDLLDGITVDARDVSQTTEILARIVARQHIGAEGWQFSREPALGAPARLLEGNEAITALIEAERARQAADEPSDDEPAEADDEARESEPPPGGQIEDLARAWFVLTGLPWVSHLLLVERTLAAAPSPELRATVAALRQSLAAGQAQAAMVARTVASRLGLPAKALQPLLADRRYQLERLERESLRQLFLRANRAAGRPLMPDVMLAELA